MYVATLTYVHLAVFALLASMVIRRQLNRMPRCQIPVPSFAQTISHDSAFLGSDFLFG
jgi:hypothetical protein